MIIFALSFFLWLETPGQTTQATDAATRTAAYAERRAREENSPFSALEFRSVGPKIMGGRVVALQGFADRPHTFFAAYASGGLWRTYDNGTVWQPLFDYSPSITIGDFAVNPKNLDEIWIGTGEENSSRSSYAGTGVYYSKDGGKNWEAKGLSDTHHISKILIDPRDPKKVMVAAMGHLYSTNEERGVFITTDGGNTWRKTLFINDRTGVIDMAQDPSDPDRIYAAAWERYRTAWNFQEAGPGSGLFISEDGGEHWSPANKGLPVGPELGRIGVTVSASNPKIVYLSVDNQSQRTDEEVEVDPLTRKKLADMTQETFLALDDEEIDRFFKGNSFHKEITATGVRTQMEAGDLTIEDIRAYLYDANQALTATQVKGVEVYRSDNQGKRWKKTHEKPIEDFAYSYGYYFGVVQVDPTDSETLFLLGVPLIKSTDGGKTFKRSQSPNVHVDHQAMWINPNNTRNILLGNDGGVYMSWDGGGNWQDFNYQDVGQFYTVAYDMAKPYNIYGGLQDNGVYYGSSAKQRIRARPWKLLMGGDGAQVQVDFRDNKTVYCGIQFGIYQRVDLETNERLSIYPRHKLKEAPLRYNWITPILLSRHLPDVVYMGAQRVMRSLDKGENWAPISDDLTTRPKIGDVPFGTITALREGHEFGTVYAGTDDGRLWLTRGAEWTEITGEIGHGLWVSSIEVSPHDAATVFVTFTGYRNDDFLAYVYKSEDFGKTWADIKGDLPEEACNVIRQDPKSPDLLFLGTDVGLFLSLDGGQHWRPHQAKLPNAPVYALEIQPREHELIVATHGRSVFVLELGILGQIKPETLEKDLHVFPTEPARFHRGWGAKIPVWFEGLMEAPSSRIYFFTRDQQKATLKISKDDVVIHRQTLEKGKGVRFFEWQYQVTEKKALKTLETHTGSDGKHYIKKGEYAISIQSKKETIEETFTVK